MKLAKLTLQFYIQKCDNTHLKKKKIGCKHVTEQHSPVSNGATVNVTAPQQIRFLLRLTSNIDHLTKFNALSVDMDIFMRESLRADNIKI